MGKKVAQPPHPLPNVLAVPQNMSVSILGSVLFYPWPIHPLAPPFHMRGHISAGGLLILVDTGGRVRCEGCLNPWNTSSSSSKKTGAHFKKKNVDESFQTPTSDVWSSELKGHESATHRLTPSSLLSSLLFSSSSRLLCNTLSSRRPVPPSPAPCCAPPLPGSQAGEDVGIM